MRYAIYLETVTSDQKPDPPPAEHLNTAGKRCHPYHPCGVDQSRALWTRIFTREIQVLSPNLYPPFSSITITVNIINQVHEK